MNNTVITAEIPVAAVQADFARIEILDVLRGFALLGIFLMNIEYFNRPFQEFGMGIPVDTSGSDYLVARLTEIFVTGKFWVLFSMLFGMGFVVMHTRVSADGRPFHAIYLRRTIALLVFGLLHIALLWSGDILHSYALVALVLMWVPVISVRASCFIGVCLYLAPAFLSLLSGVVLSFLPEEELNKILAGAGASAQSIADIALVYAKGSYWDVVQQRGQDFLHLLAYEPFIFLSAFGIFLIGAGLMRSGRLLDLKANRAFFLKAMAGFGILAVGFIGLANVFHGHSAMEPRGMIEQALMMMGNLPLSLFYLFTIAFAMSFLAGKKIFGLLAPAGKMALTNYLTQSLIGSLVFYGYGLGMWKQWGRAELAIFVLSVFVAQIIFSHLWLRFFKYGPMEWLWRSLTYWTLPPMRR